MSCKNESPQTVAYREKLNKITLSLDDSKLLNFQYNHNGLVFETGHSFNTVEMKFRKNDGTYLFDALGELQVEGNNLELSLNIISKLENVEIEFKGIQFTEKTLNKNAVDRLIIKQDSDLIIKGTITQLYKLIGGKLNPIKNN